MSAALAVDEDNPPGTLARLLQEMAPSPGRLGNTLRITVLVLISISISEVFRLPEAALAAYVVLFVSHEEASSTILSAAFAGMAVLAAIGVTIIVFMLSLAEPALRIPLIALFTFLAMFLARASSLGPIVFAAGFILAYGLTLGDDVLQLSLAPVTVGDTTKPGLPELAFIPPEEALVHFLLWLGVIVAIPIGLVILANILFGRDPGQVLRAELLDRMAAAEDFCRGKAGAGARLAAFAREGTAGLLKLQHLASVLHRAPPLPGAGALVAALDRLGRVLLAWGRLPEQEAPRAQLQPAAAACARAAELLRSGHAAPVTPLAVAPPPSAVAGPLKRALSECLAAMDSAASPASAAQAKAPKAPRRLLVPDAFTSPAHRRFAFKVTLAVMLCYLGENLTDWPGIHTCIITCFFVSLDTVGDTLHKALLRITGCLIGAALGLGTILLLMPLMTDLGELLAVVLVVTLLAAWIATGSPRISYAGWQTALAFYLVVLQGYGPTLDMETARDRIVGILIGNITVYVVFTTIWPVRIAPLVRHGLATALGHFAALLSIDANAPATARGAAEQGVAKAIGQARALVVNDRLEVLSAQPADGRRRVDATLLARVQGLIVPLSVILDMTADPVWQAVPVTPRAVIAAHHAALAAWLQRCAAWVESGNGSLAVAASLPATPELHTADGTSDAVLSHLAARDAWYRLLRQDIVAILDLVGLQAVPPEVAGDG